MGWRLVQARNRRHFFCVGVNNELVLHTSCTNPGPGQDAAHYATGADSTQSKQIGLAKRPFGKIILDHPGRRAFGPAEWK